MLMRISTPRAMVVSIVLVVLALISVHLLDAPWSLIRLREISGKGEILDMRLHYSPPEAYALLDGLGPSGREFYLWRLLGFADVLLPLIFWFFGSIAITLGFPSRPALRWFPAAALGFDYLENAAIAGLLVTFPRRHPALAAIAGWLTTTKFVFYGLSLALVLLAATRQAIKRPR